MIQNIPPACVLDRLTYGKLCDNMKYNNEKEMLVNENKNFILDVAS